MTAALTRVQILAYRRRVGSLDARLPSDEWSMRRAACAGLQDSMPRAALLSLHARVEGVEPDGWAHPSLLQLWGPRFSAYVVAAPDLGVFSLGRLPEGARSARGEELAVRLRDLLGDGRMTCAEAGRALGVHPNALRYAAPTGTVVIRWDGARQPVIWTVDSPDIEPGEARLELARRYLHVLGPGTAETFSTWAGIGSQSSRTVFDALASELTAVHTPIGDRWILTEDEEAMRYGPGPEPATRLLPSGDAYFLLWGDDRHLLVPRADARAALWTSRVWPGALLVQGEVVGTWRRAEHRVTIEPWRRLSARERREVEAEAATLPLPGLTRPVTVDWVT